MREMCFYERNVFLYERCVSVRVMRFYEREVFL